MTMKMIIDGYILVMRFQIIASHIEIENVP